MKAFWCKLNTENSRSVFIFSHMYGTGPDREWIHLEAKKTKNAGLKLASSQVLSVYSSTEPEQILTT